MEAVDRLRPRAGPLQRAWARHPRLGLAVKAAVAAALAWTVAQAVPDPAGEYPYYAPLGAMLATTTTLAGSAREAAQTVAAIVAGAGIALAVDALAPPNVVTIALVVGAGVLLAGWQRLGSARSWVPTAALFVLIIGGQDPVGYVLGYAGLTALGAVVGVAVTAAFPPLPLASSQAQLARLRDTLAAQLDDLADGLRQERPPTEEEWQERIHRIDPVLAQMRSAVQETAEARRGNRRARRYRQDVDRQYAQARALEHLALLIEDLTQVISETETAAAARVALGPGLRPPAATALAALAGALRSVEGATADPDVTRRAYDALHSLAGALRTTRARSADDLFVASSILVGIRRALAAVVPQELAEEEQPAEQAQRPTA
ncbi:hypothetical protein [Modestobacter sp. I12A-02662]|uniref:hypothetical protein n=1 Tax=Modestobacter sp. I12A-02662 TaxID=1730496 RepID=UPI0034DF514B